MALVPLVLFVVAAFTNTVFLLLLSVSALLKLRCNAIITTIVRLRDDTLRNSGAAFVTLAAAAVPFMLALQSSAIVSLVRKNHQIGSDKLPPVTFAWSHTTGSLAFLAKKKKTACSGTVLPVLLAVRW